MEHDDLYIKLCQILDQVEIATAALADIATGTLADQERELNQLQREIRNVLFLLKKLFLLKEYLVTSQTSR